jgi:threonine dehydrogenase-like Zn-dependent dehydrogenase
MRGIVYHGAEDMRVETLDDPRPIDAKSAVVRIEATAICGSDLHLYHGKMPSEAPFTVGHEFIGEVVRCRNHQSRVYGVTPELPGGQAEAAAVPVPEFWPILIPLLQAGKLTPEVVFTHRLALSEGTEAYRQFAARENGIMKVLLDPSA